MKDSSESRRSRELWVLLAGVALLTTYAQYLAVNELGVVFWLRTGLEFVSRQELMQWLAHSLLVVPGALLIGFALSEWIARTSRRAAGCMERTARTYRIAGLCFFVGLFSLYSLLRHLVMLDLPITDDEVTVRFGAEVWLDGKLGMVVPQPEGAYPNLFTHTRSGQMTSFDWPGTIALQASALATGLGHMLYALVAALGGLAAAAAAARWLGRRAGLLTGMIWLLSPMGLTLSLTEHAHVLSRTCIMVAFYFISVIDTTHPDRSRLGAGLGLGVAVGLGALARPFEVGFMMLPVALWLLVATLRRSPGARAAITGALLGFLPLLALHAMYNWAITGHPALQPRFDAEHVVANHLAPESAVTRIGSHVAHNLMMLAVFALGPVASVLAGLAPLVSGHCRPVALLSCSVLSVFGLALFHDNIGIHSVGPIHYSEAFGPIALLFVFFVFGAARRITCSAMRSRLIAGVMSYSLIALSLLSVNQLRALANQADMTNLPLAALEQHNIHNAIIIAPPRAFLYMPGSSGSWVLDYPPPRPDDDWIFVKPDADLDRVRETYPGRTVWQLLFDPRLGAIGFRPVKDG